MQDGETAFRLEAQFAVKTESKVLRILPRPGARANDPIRLNLAGFEGRQ
jgi:hypothetical protein